MSDVNMVLKAKQVQRLTKFNDMLVDCLASCPNGTADIDQVKKLLFEEYRHQLYTGGGPDEFEHYIATNEGQQASKKIDVRLAKTLQRSP
jgi:hypothetical protein